jgi:hypothetical protein
MARNVTQPTEPPDALLSRVEQRVRGRRHAADLAFLIPESDLDCPHFMEALVEHLRKLGDLNQRKESRRRGLN